jgi:hypothetical protein
LPKVEVSPAAEDDTSPVQFVIPPAPPLPPYILETPQFAIPAPPPPPTMITEELGYIPQTPPLPPVLESKQHFIPPPPPPPPPPMPVNTMHNAPSAARGIPAPPIPPPMPSNQAALPPIFQDAMNAPIVLPMSMPPGLIFLYNRRPSTATSESC